MQKILLFFIISIAGNSSFSQDKAFDSFFENLFYFKNEDSVISKNGIRLETIYEYTVKDNLITDSFLTTSILYDHKGIFIKYTTYLKTEISSVTSRYVDTANSLERIQNIYLLKEARRNKYPLKLKFKDSAGNFFKEIWIDKTSDDSLIVENHFLQNNLISHSYITLGRFGKFLSTQYYYEKDKLLRTDFFASTGALTWSTLHTYNNDFSQEKIGLFKDKKYYFQTIRYYGEDEKLQKIQMALPDKNGSWTNKKWNKKNLQTTIIYRYNIDGTLGERISEKSDGEITIEKRFYSK